MKSFETTIRDENGLHARPAGLLVKDAQALSSEFTIECRGKSANLKKLLASGMRVWVRIPIIPGVNDTADEMRDIKSFFDENGYPEKIELLPYHTMGEHKYSALGRESHVFSVPSEEKMKELKSVFGV